VSSTTEEQTERTCAKCGETDHHAHHVQYVAFQHPVSRQSMDLSVTKHVQCCAEDGCEVCAVAVKHAHDALDENDRLPSDRFNEFLMNPPQEYLRELGISPPEET